MHVDVIAPLQGAYSESLPTHKQRA